MKIKKLKIENFRLHQSLTLDVNNNSIVIVGNNASGKTTIVEAIYYCCFFTSFRIKNQSELIKFNTDVSSVSIDYQMESNNTDDNITIYFDKDKRNIIFNQQKNQRRIEMIGKIKVLLLNPSTDQYVTQGPGFRRKYLDIYISQYNYEYKLKLAKYQNLTKQRNACLKADNVDYQTLEIITEKYDQLIVELRFIRIKFIAQISKLSNSIVNLLSRGEDELSLSYVNSKAEKLDKEIRYGRSLYGLQFDDFDIYLNQKLAKTYASQGQQRSISIALILSQIELIYKNDKEFPVVIIDDVHIELDKYRQQVLFNILSEQVQAFFVSTSCANIPENIKLASICYTVERKNEVTFVSIVN